MTGVAPWLTATVCFVDLDQLPRDLRLEVRTAGRLVAPNCYDVVASYALSYSQAARGKRHRADRHLQFHPVTAPAAF